MNPRYARRYTSWCTGLRGTVGMVAGLVMVAFMSSSPVVASVGASVSAQLVGEPVSWLGAGDSFSSGEGIPKAVGDCEQSERAFAPRAARLLETERGVNVDPVVMTACTGAVTQDFFNRNNKSHPTQTVWAREGLVGGRYDVASLSFGGNDVDFGEVMTDCLFHSGWGSLVKTGDSGCSITPAEMTERISDVNRGIGTNKDSGPFGRGGTDVDLATFYAQVATDHLTEGGTLVVVGYPRLIAPSDQWPAWRNGRCGQIGAKDADMIGDAAVLLDETTKAAAQRAQTMVEGRTISYVSRLDIFDAGGASRSLCTRNGASWINGVSSVAWNQRRESPYHPNELGHLATAERVAANVWKVIKTKTAPVPDPSESSEPTEEPTEEEVAISDGMSTFGIGERFEGECSVAWPTSPTITATTIELTTFCPGDVPEQFTFVYVIYPDPDLPITPMSGFSRVEGEIVGTSVSGVGLKSLVVEADTYILDVS